MKFKIASVFFMLVCIYHINTLPLLPPFKLPSLTSIMSIPLVSKKLAMMGVHSAKGVAQAVAHPKATLSATKETIKEKSLDIVFEIAKKTFGPLFPMYLLFNFYMKLKLGTAYNHLEVAEQFIRSCEFHSSEINETDRLHQKAMKYIQKKALDKPKEILQKKALEHAEYIVGSIKSRMPDAYKMDSAELDFWTAFEVGLSNDLKSYIEFVHAHQNELADIKYKELEEKFKVIFKEQFKDSFDSIA